VTRQREFASDPAELDRELAYHRAATPMEALVEAAPGAAIDMSAVELLSLRSILADAMDLLDVEERELVNAYFIECRQLRVLAREWGIPKTTLFRRRDDVLVILRTALSAHPLIVAYLER
jgi:hypothetical protein